MAEASASSISASTSTCSSFAEATSVNIPYEIFLIIADYAPIEPLLTLRSVSKGVKAYVDEIFSDDEWAKRISTIPAGICAEKVSVHTRLTLACLKSPCCSLCGVKYTARGKGTDDIFGVYAHEKCRKKQLFKHEKVARMLNRFVPDDGGSSSSTSSARPNRRAIYISSGDIQKFGCKTQKLQGYIRGGYYMDDPWDYFGGSPHYSFDALWLMPRWCTRDTFHDAVVAKKEEDSEDKKVAAIYDALEKTRKDEASKVDRKKARAAKKEANEEQRLSEFRDQIGPGAYSKIIQLENDLEKTKRALKKKHGKSSYEWPDEVMKVWNEAVSGKLVNELGNVKRGRNSSLSFDKETKEYKSVEVGAGLPVSTWKAYLVSATRTLDAYKKKYPTAVKQPPKKKAKTRA